MRSPLDFVLGMLRVNEFLFIVVEVPLSDDDSGGRSEEENLDGDFRWFWLILPDCSAITSYNLLRYSSTESWIASLNVGTTS